MPAHQPILFFVTSVVFAMLISALGGCRTQPDAAGLGVALDRKVELAIIRLYDNPNERERQQQVRQIIDAAFADEPSQSAKEFLFNISMSPAERRSILNEAEWNEVLFRATNPVVVDARYDRRLPDRLSLTIRSERACCFDYYLNDKPLRGIHLSHVWAKDQDVLRESAYIPVEDLHSPFTGWSGKVRVSESFMKALKDAGSSIVFEFDQPEATFANEWTHREEWRRKAPAKVTIVEGELQRTH